MESFRGNYIGGEFVLADGERFVSTNPASPRHTVFAAISAPDQVDRAVQAARAALGPWRRLPLSERIAAVGRIKDVLPRHVERLADAVRLEMGKVRSEARLEARSIAAKITTVVDLLPQTLPPGGGPDAPGITRWHALGVVAVLGPFNFPIHLMHTHVVPALLTGNTVIAKPSEVTPLVGQRYAELLDDAGLPAGVFNLVHGLGDVGAALTTHSAVRGVTFTGSYHTGRIIRQATLDQPYKKICLELGGKNAAVILDDADLDQAEREILLGALLTTGQRCTATSRVIATKGIAGRLKDRLKQAFSRIQPGDPQLVDTFMGPLATAASRDRFLRLCRAGREEGMGVVVESRSLAGGFYVTPALYLAHGGERLLHEELFGPHVSFEVAEDMDDAFARAADSPYGLSASLFTAREALFEDFYDRVTAGVMNLNRSTNGASGQLPFGGIGMSGNFRPTGALSPRMVTYPVAVMRVPFGQVTPHTALESQLA